MREYWELFAAFLRIGILTFGGGLTMLPMLKYELVEKRNWITEDTLLDCYAIGQCTPGIIAVNTATFVGYKRKGISGGIISTLGMAAPSVLIITVVALFLEVLVNHPITQHALMGIRGVVCALMLNTVLNLAKKSLVSPICVAICVVAFLLVLLTEIPTIMLIVLAGAAGVVIQRVTGGTK